MSQNIAASVRQKLLNLANAQQEDFQGILTRYTLERLLYRLSQSKHRDRFILKGAMLFTLWSDEPHRATRDLDLLGKGDNSIPHLEQVFQDICSVPVEEDGLHFRAETVKGEQIKGDKEYPGMRIKLNSVLTGTNTRIAIQVDIGFGDAIFPAIQEAQFPVILAGFPAPLLNTYPRETVIAEKFQAMVLLGIANTRMKDFYDVWYLCQNFTFEGKLLSQSIKATFVRRKTDLPTSLPLALTAEFFEDMAKQAQWKAFIRKGKFSDRQEKLASVTTQLQAFLMPPTIAIAQEEIFDYEWSPSGPWQILTPQSLRDSSPLFEKASPSGGEP
jgi:predicted nucleotidyltransferase component of viral defense system